MPRLPPTTTIRDNRPNGIRGQRSGGGSYDPAWIGHYGRGGAVTFEGAARVLGGTARRRLALAHLRGLSSFLEYATSAPVCLWVRGELASTPRPEPNALDVVALVDATRLPQGPGWAARVLEAAPVLSPIELMFVMVSPRDDEAVERERRRSAVRCRDNIGEPIVTGWLEVTS